MLAIYIKCHILSEGKSDIVKPTILKSLSGRSKMKKAFIYAGFFLILAGNISFCGALPGLFERTVTRNSDLGIRTGYEIYDIVEFGGQVWLATGDWVYYTADDGTNWHICDLADGLPSSMVSAIYADNLNDVIWVNTNHLDAGDEIFSDGLSFTIDQGQTWSTITPDGSYGSYQIIYDITGYDNMIFCSSWYGGLFGSFDDGYTWKNIYFSELDSINSDDPGNLSNLYFSTVLDMNHKDSTVLWAGSAAGLRRYAFPASSADFDEVINFEYPDITGNFVTALGIQVLPDNNSRIWATTKPAVGVDEYMGVSTATLDGQDWKLYPDFECWNFEFNGDTVFMATSGGLLYSSNIDGPWDTLALTDINPDTWIISVRLVGDYLWVGTLGECLVRIDKDDFTQQKIICPEESSTDVPNELIRLHSSLMLSQNYPNPFNAGTDIRYSLPYRSQVTIEIFNLLGQKIKTVVDEEKPAGNYTVTWDGTDDRGNTVASGIYFYRIKAGNHVDSKKMLMLK